MAGSFAVVWSGLGAVWVALVSGCLLQLSLEAKREVEARAHLARSRWWFVAPSGHRPSRVRLGFVEGVGQGPLEVAGCSAVITVGLG